MKLEVKSDNLYTTGYIVEFPDNTALLLRKQIEYIPASQDEFKIIPEGLDLCDIAYDKYNNSKRWFILADANNIFNPFELDHEKPIVIPDLDKLLATIL